MSILVTRPSPAGEELVSRLRTLGQVAWHFPLIEFSPGRQLPQLADQLAALGESDLLFALSQHAVAFAQSQLHQQDRKWPRLPTYFAIGRTTALALHTVSGQKILGKSPKDRDNHLKSYKILRAVRITKYCGQTCADITWQWRS